MVSRKRSGGVARIKAITMGYALMAIALFIVQVLRFFGTNAVVEFAAMGVTLFAWILVFTGFAGLARYGGEFRRGKVAAMAGAVFVVLEVIFAIRGLRSEVSGQAFIDIYVLFFTFASVVTMLYAYAKAFKGYGPYVARASEQVAARYPRTTALVGVLLILFMIAIPIMMMLPKVPGFLGTFIMASLALLLQLYVCRLLLDGYQALYRRRFGEPMKEEVPATEAKPVVTKEKEAEADMQPAAESAPQVRKVRKVREAPMDDVPQQIRTTGPVADPAEEAGKAVGERPRDTVVYSREELERALQARHAANEKAARDTRTAESVDRIGNIEAAGNAAKTRE